MRPWWRFRVWEVTSIVVLTSVMTVLFVVRPGSWGDPSRIIDGPLRFLVVVIPAAIVLTALHETAHAVVGRLVGWRLFGVTLGLGPRLLAFDLGSTHVELRGTLVGGATFATPTGHRWRDAAMLSAGVAVEAVVIAIVLAWGPTSAWGQAAKWAIIVVACLDIAVNLWPRRVDVGPISGLATDGAQLLSIFTTPEAWRDDVQLRQITPGHARVMQTLQGGDLDRAVELAAEQHATDDDPRSDVLFGTLLLLADRWREAFDRLGPHADDADADYLVTNNAAWAAVMTFDPGLLAEADRWSARAYELRPDEAACVSTRGSTLVLVGRIAEGRALLEQAAAGRISRQQRASVEAFLAVAEHRSGRFDEARAHLATSRSLHADCPTIPEIERLLAGVARPGPWPAPHPAARVDATG